MKRSHQHQHHRLSKKAKRMLAVALFDAVMKTAGIAMFLIGLGALGEVPTDPKMIVRALGLFIGGICLIAWNGAIADRKGESR